MCITKKKNFFFVNLHNLTAEFWASRRYIIVEVISLNYFLVLNLNYYYSL